MPTPVISISIRFPADQHPDMIGAARDADISLNAWVVKVVANELKRKAKRV